MYTKSQIGLVQDKQGFTELVRNVPLSFPSRIRVRDKLRREFLLEFTPAKAGAGMTPLGTSIFCFRKSSGFTLIELMIVIAIIAIIAAIAIPNLLTGRISANENSAVASLRLLTNAEAMWSQQDPDGNAIKDYWTYDVSCIHRMFHADNVNKTAFIPIDLAKADFAPADLNGGVLPFGGIQIEVWSSVLTGTKSGYWFQTMTLDAPGGNAYKRNTVGTNNIPACNNNRYGFMAVPEVYGQSGVNSLIVNEAGTVFANDTGLTIAPWKTTAAGGMDWPGTNPAGTDGPSGRKWRVAD
ncbi:MAG: DUF2950 family protein [Planctomycetota bacterium]